MNLLRNAVRPEICLQRNLFFRDTFGLHQNVRLHRFFCMRWKSHFNSILPSSHHAIILPGIVLKYIKWSFCIEPQTRPFPNQDLDCTKRLKLWFLLHSPQSRAHQAHNAPPYISIQHRTILIQCPFISINRLTH